MVSGTGDICEVLRIELRDGAEKVFVNGLLKFEREIREKRRIIRMSTSLLVGGPEAMPL